MAPRIAGLWAVPQYVDLMGARSREGLPEALRRADPMVVPPIVDLTGEQPSAELTGEPSIAVVRIMVALTVPITGLVPLRQASRLGRLPVPRRRAIATTRPIVPRHRTIIRHTDRSPDQAVPLQHDELLRRCGAHSSGAVFPEISYRWFAGAETEDAARVGANPEIVLGSRSREKGGYSSRGLTLAVGCRRWPGSASRAIESSHKKLRHSRKG